MSMHGNGRTDTMVFLHLNSGNMINRRKCKLRIHSISIVQPIFDKIILIRTPSLPFLAKPPKPNPPPLQYLPATLPPNLQSPISHLTPPNLPSPTSHPLHCTVKLKKKNVPIDVFIKKGKNRNETKRNETKRDALR